MPQKGPKYHVVVKRPVYERLDRLRGKRLSFNTVISLLLDIAEPQLEAILLEELNAPWLARAKPTDDKEARAYLTALVRLAGLSPGKAVKR